MKFKERGLKTEKACDSMLQNKDYIKTYLMFIYIGKTVNAVRIKLTLLKRNIFTCKLQRFVPLI